MTSTRSPCRRCAYVILGSIVIGALNTTGFVATAPQRVSSVRLALDHKNYADKATTQCKDESPSDSDTEVDTIMASRRAFLTSVSAGAIVAAATMSPKEAKAADEKERLIDSELLLASSASSQSIEWEAILKKASKKALGGGKAGAAAAIVQVCSLMWLRTSMNYQYRYGGDLGTSLKTLWEEGGIARLYQGLGFALVQGPATRFFDTASNVGILALLESFPETASLPIPLKTACASLLSGASRIMLMPIDTAKTSMQVEGAEGLERLWTRVNEQGPAPLYQGAFASAAATAAGHFPWFTTYNLLNANLPTVPNDDLLLSLLRNAFIGLSASCVSDCFSNSLRVLKTTKQTAGLGKDGQDMQDLSYGEVLQLVIEKDGVLGLLGRGLQTRLLANMIQGAVFSVLWKYFQTVLGVQ